MDETKSVDDLKISEYNPRNISRERLDQLTKLMERFGDLGGIIKNIETGNLVGGNQRVRVFKKLKASDIHIEKRMSDGPTAAGTTAYGYVIMPNGEQFSYREVMWPPNVEKAANAAANHAGGEDDKDLLAQMTYELSQDDSDEDLLALMGMDEKEQEKLLKHVGVDLGDQEDEKPKNDVGTRPIEFRLSESQLSVVEQALGIMKRQRQLTLETNRDLNGNALYYICQNYIDGHEPEPSLTDIP